MVLEDMVVVIASINGETWEKHRIGDYVGSSRQEEVDNQELGSSKYQSTLRLTKSVLAAVVDSGATSKKEGEATVNPPAQSPYTLRTESGADATGVTLFRGPGR